MSDDEPVAKFWCPEHSYKCTELPPMVAGELCPKLMYVFPAACRYLVDGMEYCDEPPINEDCGCFGPRDQCCIICYPCLSPLGLAVDLITLPFRTIYCVGYKTKKCCC